MARTLATAVLVCVTTIVFAQSSWTSYEPSSAHPYGQKHPDAPEQINDFAPMIGSCDCQSLRRNPDGTWADTTHMTWQFKYIMNGHAIQDQTWADGFYATSIRQFHPDSNQWVVGYNAFPGVTTKPGTWLGSRIGEDIVLSLPQKAPNGMDGTSRLTFTNISDAGWDWRGEWVSEDQTIVYPFWLIWCRR